MLSSGKSRNGIALAVTLTAAFAFAPATAFAQTRSEPFGQERVQTREFRNKDAERAFNARATAAHSHRHNGHKGHKGHKH